MRTLLTPLLALLMACGPSKKEQCTAARSEAVTAWDHVTDYYFRKDQMVQTELDVVTADAEAAQAQRDRAVRINTAPKPKPKPGLVDVRSGKEQAQGAPPPRPKKVAVAPHADDEEEAVAELSIIEQRLEVIGAHQAMSTALRDLTRSGTPDEIKTRLAGTPPMDTDLYAPAVEATEALIATCGS